MLGGAHATANPLTARHNLIHGQAVSFMLPHVMQFNVGDAGTKAIFDRYGEILQSSGISTLPLIEWVSRLVAACSFPGLKIDANEIGWLADAAARQWTGRFNPRPLAQADYAKLYRTAFILDETE